MLVAIYGRRRVGKTALIEVAYQNDLLWKFDGIENVNTRTQILIFF
jgi:Archaeal ATPase.